MTEALDAGSEIHRIAARISNWGRWGQDDELGTTNLIEPHLIAQAAHSVKKGKGFALAIPFDFGGPQLGAVAGRFNPVHSMLSTGTDALSKPHGPNGFGYADDLITMPLQCATQWDGLSHVFHEGRMYNGFGANLVSSQGASRNGIEKLAQRLVGRAVLLDVPGYLGVEANAPGHAITSGELETVAAREKVEIRRGDILLVRTGWMAPFLASGTWNGYADGDCPGISYTAAEWLHDRDIAAIASDTYRVEVKPTDLVGARSPLHILALVYMGMPLGEIFNLEDLAKDCLDDGVYEMLLVAAPLPFTGAVGSPINPYAIK
jgi:kynurenine formamidase